MKFSPKRVNRDYKPKDCCVYVISNHAKTPNPLLGKKSLAAFISGVVNGNVNYYVGMTSIRPVDRFKDHRAKRSDERYHTNTSDFIKRNNLSAEESMTILFEGSGEECARFEYMLRPRANMGQNMQVGGWRKRNRTLDPRICSIFSQVLAA
jgi:hypothetical protein